MEHDDCSKFLICDENTWKTMQCENGMSFDRELKACHWLKKEKCAEAIYVSFLAVDHLGEIANK
jgi:hypothetical protein